VLGLRLVPRGKVVLPESALQLVLLDNQANVREKRDLLAPRPFPDSPGFLVADLDGDGSDDVLFIDQNKLIATSAGLTKTAWEWPLPEKFKSIHEVLPGAGGKPATVVVLAEDRVYGLDGRTGRMRWQAEVQGKLAGVLLDAGPRGETAVVVVTQETGSPVTVCLLAPILGEDRPAPGDAIETPLVDPPVRRCLPWVGEYQRLMHWAPLYFMLRGRAFWLTAVFVVLLCVGGWLLWLGWRRSRRWKVPAILCLVGGAGMGLSLGSDLAALEHILKPVPWILFALALVAALFRQEWRRAGWLALASLLLGVSVSGAWLAFDSRTLQVWERYDLVPLVTGWLLGAAAVGVLLPLLWLVRGLRSLRRRGAG
jgi:hypothetical protein